MQIGISSATNAAKGGNNLADIDDDPSKEIIHFQDGKFDSYKLTFSESSIELECYLLGSPAGGPGTECTHSIIGSVSSFLAIAGFTSIEDLAATAKQSQSETWSRLHTLIQQNQTDGWIWNETNWNE